MVERFIPLRLNESRHSPAGGERCSRWHRTLTKAIPRLSSWLLLKPGKEFPDLEMVLNANEILDDSVHPWRSLIMAITVKISSRSQKLLGELARETGSPMTEVLDAALEGYRRQRLLDQANTAYEALAADSAAWDSYRQEVDSLDATIADGLDSDV